MWQELLSSVSLLISPLYSVNSTHLSCICVGGIAWDWVNQKLYWTDYCDDDIEIYDPVTRVRRVLFDVGLSAPYAIVVDPTTGYGTAVKQRELTLLIFHIAHM